MKQILHVVIEIEANNTHTVRNIEQALNFYWGHNGRFTVTEVGETKILEHRACGCWDSEDGKFHIVCEAHKGKDPACTCNPYQLENYGCQCGAREEK